MRAYVQLIALLLPLVCFGQPFSTGDQAFTALANSTASTPPCTTAKDSQTYGANCGVASFIQGFGTLWAATKFTAGSTYTVCSIVSSLYKVGTPGPGTNMVLSIYTDNSNKPGTLISSSSGVQCNTFSTSKGDITFSNLSASLTSGTSYWIVYHFICGSGGDTANYAVACYWAPGTGRVDSTDGTTWNIVDAGQGFQFTLYSQ